MVTKIHNSKDAIDALNENLEGMITGKRKLPLGKEVNNNIGKHLNVIKLEQVERLRVGDKTPLDWFVDNGQRRLTGWMPPVGIS